MLPPPHRPSAADLSPPPERLWRPTGEFIPMARRLPGDLIFLAVSDPRDSMPAMIEGLPMILGQMNQMFPAVQQCAGRLAVPNARTISNRSSWE